MGRTIRNSFEEGFAELAVRKREAALTRLAGREPGAEKPREVFLKACEGVASSFARDGFRYFRSKQEFSREVGVFRHRVGFRSSRLNIPGRYIVMWITADVRCSRLASWRREQTHPLSGRSDFLAGGSVHLIEDKHAWVEWQLADPRERQATIDDAVGFLRSVVLPYFARFDDPMAVLSGIEEQVPVKEFTMVNQIDFALCFGQRDLAQRVLTRAVAADPDLQRSIRRALEVIKREGLDDYTFNRFNGERAAYAHLAHGLALEGMEPPS